MAERHIKTENYGQNFPAKQNYVRNLLLTEGGKNRTRKGEQIMKIQLHTKRWGVRRNPVRKMGQKKGGQRGDDPTRGMGRSEIRRLT